MMRLTKTQRETAAIRLQAHGAARAERARLALLALVHGAYLDPCERLEVEMGVIRLQRESYWDYSDARILVGYLLND